MSTGIWGRRTGGGENECREARELLDGITPSDLVFASQRFRDAVARARLARAAGKKVEAKQHAEDALREAARDSSDFPRHPTVGLVDANRKVTKEMRKLARPWLRPNGNALRQYS